MPKNPAYINLHHILKVRLIWNGFRESSPIYEILKPLVLAWNCLVLIESL